MGCTPGSPDVNWFGHPCTDNKCPVPRVPYSEFTPEKGAAYEKAEADEAAMAAQVKVEQEKELARKLELAKKEEEAATAAAAAAAAAPVAAVSADVVDAAVRVCSLNVLVQCGFWCVFFCGVGVGGGALWNGLACVEVVRTYC